MPAAAPPTATVAMVPSTDGPSSSSGSSAGRMSSRMVKRVSSVYLLRSGIVKVRVSTLLLKVKSLSVSALSVSAWVSAVGRSQ